MRLLDRNKQTIKYALCNTNSFLADSDGNYTGERQIIYDSPVELRCRVTSAAGRASIDQFGVNVDYDRVLQIEGTGLGITETTVLWIDDLDGDYDYIVRKVAESLNHTTLAVKKVR